MLSMGILLLETSNELVGSRKYDWILMISLCVFYPIAWDINKLLQSLGLDDRIENLDNP